ncbi:MAG: RNA polymerase sigma factor [Clostridia bacterium]|nr:RNA polymerase sigma factor [Clostridia bacterium]
MEDSKIVDLFWERSETAIEETQKKYRRYCHSIAFNILGSNEDAEECVNDTYVRVWDSIPPKRPDPLSAFIGKTTRRLAFDRYRKKYAKKRGRGTTALVLDELYECIPALVYPTDIADDIVLRDALKLFLASLPEESMKLFMRRYWYTGSIADIAREHGISESNVKIRLHRIRCDLKKFLEKEGIIV